MAEAKKACPFCGSAEPVIDTLKWPSGKPRQYRVWCLCCNAFSGWHESEADAVKAWNRRVALQYAQPWRWRSRGN